MSVSNCEILKARHKGRAELQLARDALLNDEQNLIFTKFDNAIAIALGQQMLTSAQAQGLALTLEINRSGQQLFHVALPGTVTDLDFWIRRKCAVVSRFGHASLFVAVECLVDGEDLFKDYGLDPAHYTSAGGAFPIIVRDVGVVGAIAASGTTEEEEHVFVVAEIARFIGLMSP